MYKQVGSTAGFEPSGGGFAEYVICRAENAVMVAPGIDAAKAAFAEPLAVCLHAVSRATVYGARVLIAGAGPIGSLLVLACRFAGRARSS